MFEKLNSRNTKIKNSVDGLTSAVGEAEEWANELGAGEGQYTHLRKGEQKGWTSQTRENKQTNMRQD